MARSGPDTSGGTAPGPGAPVVIDCDDCAARADLDAATVWSACSSGYRKACRMTSVLRWKCSPMSDWPLGCAWCRSAASADPVSRKVVACRCPWSPIAEVRSSTAKW